MKFRKDINGLRAIAVIAVVLFHFNTSWMPGGFAGVDVFFVISGFLMTGIIFRGVEQDSFSIFKFYVARANRIIPALALLCLVLMVFGWFYLTPFDYRILGKHVASSIGFLSNVMYWREAGYFDAASLEKWLLHTWTLSVEWQFYIIYPLVLVAMRKFLSIKTMKLMILVATVLGFIFCVFSTYRWPNASYFLLSARAWEMLIGGVAYLYPFTLQESRKKFVEWTGIALVISSYFLISAANPWPGYLALFPVLGSFLIIQAQRNDSIITSNIVFQKLGTWSYSIYLWHWPIVVAIYYFSLNEAYIYPGMALSILLGFLSYKYVEKIKFRNDFVGMFSYLKHKPIYIVLAVGVMGSFVFLDKGVEERFSLSASDKNIIDSIKMPHRNNGYCFNSSSQPGFEVSQSKGVDCYLGKKETDTKTLLFGDSYAGHNEPFFDEVFKANDASFQSIVTNWCVPSLTENYTGPKTNNAYEQCLLNRKYLKENMQNYENLIFAGSWGSALEKRQLEDVEELIDKAAKLDLNIFIMAAPYQYQKNPIQDFYRSIYFNLPFNIDAFDGSDTLVNEANTRLDNLSRNYRNVYYIDRKMLYEESNTFEVDGINVPYTLDGGHISVIGSKHSAKHFMNHAKYKSIMSRFNL
ncbi:acyltransferase family protein [Psychrobacter frigidicola]|uniref:acyltransferase family protein n=1 Tax=Psychrobacter frigidicola TaxID=45611 RepID=UPI001919910D|nr:acyltransferase family protein [Psychrobacter frigidicola]